MKFTKILFILAFFTSCNLKKTPEDIVNLEIEALNKKDAGYTTTLKLMQIMHEKQLVDRDASSKSHVYRAIISQEKTQQQMVNKMIDNVFNGSAARLVMQALGNKNASKEEIDLIKEYLNNLENK